MQGIKEREFRDSRLPARVSDHYSGLAKLLKNDPLIERISGKIFLIPELKDRWMREVPLDFLKRLLASVIPNE